MSDSLSTAEVFNQDEKNALATLLGGGIVPKATKTEVLAKAIRMIQSQHAPGHDMDPDISELTCSDELKAAFQYYRDSGVFRAFTKLASFQFSRTVKGTIQPLQPWMHLVPKDDLKRAIEILEKQQQEIA